MMDSKYGELTKQIKALNKEYDELDKSLPRKRKEGMEAFIRRKDKAFKKMSAVNQKIRELNNKRYELLK